MARCEWLEGGPQTGTSSLVLLTQLIGGAQVLLLPEAAADGRRRAGPAGPGAVVVKSRKALRGSMSKSYFKRCCQLLVINAHKMAPRTSQGLQERAWDNPTKGLLWSATQHEFRGPAPAGAVGAGVFLLLLYYSRPRVE